MKLNVDAFGAALAETLNRAPELLDEPITATFLRGYANDAMVQVHFKSGQVMRLLLVDVSGIEPSIFDLC